MAEISSPYSAPGAPLSNNPDWTWVKGQADSSSGLTARADIDVHAQVPNASNLSGETEVLREILAGGAPASAASDAFVLTYPIATADKPATAPAASKFIPRFRGLLVSREILAGGAPAPAASGLSGKMRAVVPVVGQAGTSSNATAKLLVNYQSFAGQAPCASDAKIDTTVGAIIRGWAKWNKVKAPSAAAFSGGLTYDGTAPDDGAALGGDVATAAFAKANMSGGGATLGWWTLRDPSTYEEIRFRVTRGRGTSVDLSKNLLWSNTAAVNGKTLAVEGGVEPEIRTVAGTVLEQAGYEDLRDWAKKRHPITLTDDLNQKSTVYIQLFESVRRQSPVDDYQNEYVLKYMVV